MEEELPDSIHLRKLQYKIESLEKEIDTFPVNDPKKATSQRLLDILHDQSQKIALRFCCGYRKQPRDIYVN
jgi:hypothetical protein